MINELANKIWNRQVFQDEYKLLIQIALMKQVDIDTKNLILSHQAIKRLLQSASTFAASDNNIFKESANRIAMSIWYSFGIEYENLSELILFILGRTGNFPTAALFENKLLEEIEYIDFIDPVKVLIAPPKKQRRLENNTDTVMHSIGLNSDFDEIYKYERISSQEKTIEETKLHSPFPTRLSFEVSHHKDSNRVELREGEQVIFTDFQFKLWTLLTSGTSVSVSAPKSAGKSYALQRFLAKISTSKPTFIAVYIVLTRALINQVSLALTELVSKYTNNSVSISSVPIPLVEIDGAKILYVLTQERLHNLIVENPKLKFDLIIVDESQTISADDLSDNSRGVILQTVIEEIIKISGSDTQIMFASPLTQNPEIFPEIFNLLKVVPINENESPVPQNMFLLNIIESKKVEINYLFNDNIIRLGSKHTQVTKTILNTEVTTLAYIAWEFAKLEKSIVFSNGPSSCEKIAYLLDGWMKKYNLLINNTFVDTELEEFSKFIREHVHQSYQLADSIINGIAFHYGNMPALIRKTIEEFYDEGKLTYLVCTGTLLHGVNLPAKNLFLLNPKRVEVIRFLQLIFGIYLVELAGWEKTLAVMCF